MGHRIRMGDIIEIPTKKGFAYAQFTHKHSRYGALIRILPGFFETRPSHFTELAQQREIFTSFFPLQAAVNRGIFEVVAHCAIPEKARQFPLFRDGGVDPTTGKVETWWLWDGEREWKVGEISQEQRGLPIREIINDTLLIERIESGWTPRTDPA